MLTGASRFRSWLDLCRLPYSMSVAADPLAGALIAGATWAEMPFAICLMLAVFFFHAGAVALNDWHDFKIDRVENPDRPIAAGKIGRWYGLFGAGVLLVVGWTFTSVPGNRHGQLGLGLLAGILLYEFIMKGAPAGKALPGIVRALAMMMGTMLVPVTQSTANWPMRVFFMCILAVYALGAAVLAQRPPDHLRRAIAISGSIIVGLAVMALALTRLFFPVLAPHSIAAVWIGGLLIVVGYPLSRAIARPADATLGAAAWYAVLGAILVDAAAVAFIRNLPASLAVALVLLPVVYGRYMLDRVPAENDGTSPAEPSAT